MTECLLAIALLYCEDGRHGTMPVFMTVSPPLRPLFLTTTRQMASPATLALSVRGLGLCLLLR